MRILTWTFVGSCLLAGALNAQTSELTGRVTDPSGQPVPNARVTGTRQGTDAPQERSTNQAGYFFFQNVIPGVYKLKVEMAGFKTIDREGITIATADRARADFQLEIGALAETVNVNEDTSLLQVGSADISTTINTREYDQLPQIQYNRMRSPATFLYLSPGVQGKITTAGADNVSASNSIQIYGSPKTSNELYLDGTPTRTNFNETAPPLDAIGEFKLQANSLSAEYGNTGSAVVSFTVRSGTNQVHGLMFDILQNNALDARGFLAPQASTVHQNEFGANIGAPVFIPKVYNGRNKTFLFFAYVGSRKTGFDQYQRLRIPTNAQRIGDFSGSGRNIYDPLSTSISGSTFVRTMFPGNVIPASRFDPVAVNVIKLLPALNLTGAGTLNYQAPIGEVMLNPDVYTARVDQSVGPNQRANLSYTHTYIPRNNVTAAFADPFSDKTSQLISSDMFHAGWDWVAKPNLLNSALYGFNRFINPFAGYFANQGYAAKFGLKGTVGDSFPSFTFGDGYAPMGRVDNSANIDQSLIVKDMLTWTHGRHVVKTGFEFRTFYSPVNDSSNSAGTYSFSNLGTALPTSNGNTGDSYASFLLGQVNTASISYPFVSESLKHYVSGFVQDDFRMLPNLTLNLGFRYEAVLAPYEINNQYSLVDLQTPNPLAGGRPGASIFAGSGTGRTGSNKLTNTLLDGFGPRVGFAWQLGHKTAIRGGYGIFYADNGIFAVTTGFRTLASFQTPDQGITPPFILSKGVPAVSTTLSLTPDLLNGQNVTTRTPNAGAQPRVQNWSASAQRELARNLVLEFSYVANRSTRLSAASLVDINQLDPKYLALGSLLTQNITSTAARAANIPVPYPGFTGTVAQALRPYPQYQTITDQSAKAGGAFYNALTARARKRYSNGITFDAHFTWSQNKGNADGTVQNDYNRGAEWAYLNSDVPYALVMHWSYEIPSAKFARTLTSGWVINGIHYYQSGTPLYVTMTNNLPIFNSRLRPNAVSGVDLSSGISNGNFQPNTDSAINKAAFSTPAPFTFGNAAPSYNGLRNFPVLQEDFSLLKNTKIGDKVTLETIGQFINALNRHRFASINTNFSNSTFGTVTATNLGRIITVGMKLRF